MADTKIEYLETRFNMRGELNECYVYIDVIDDDMGPASPQGWHFKAFPATKSMQDIVGDWASGKEEPLMWPKKAPSRD